MLHIFIIIIYLLCEVEYEVLINLIISFIIASCQIRIRFIIWIIFFIFFENKKYPTRSSKQF